MESSPPCPSTVTVRRNPRPVKARPNPAATEEVPISTSLPSVTSSDVKAVVGFPMEEILSAEVDHHCGPSESIHSNSVTNATESESLKVFLRVRSALIHQDSRKGSKGNSCSRPLAAKNAWPKSTSAKEKGGTLKMKEVKSCITINGPDSVTISAPPSDFNRSKSEIYNGFTHVFPMGATQDEVYGKMVSPIVEDFINGRGGMLAAMGPSGSGKTYTMFGSNREPGIVPSAIRHIFTSSTKDLCTRCFYLSMFEIYSDKGKVEKLSDLSPEGGDVHLQHSVLKGLKEVPITDAAQAESLVAAGMSRRATAATNTNSQSSRSHCIINIRRAVNESYGGIETQLDDAMLTFVDLAGAEREKKTGNQGKRLLEGNFINNTSMVFGLCLRSLLEHQKNPKKLMQKHFQSSLLTRYLRDYLEGKKRMALILTVRPGERDYLDTSFLLRQASPYMEIKFHNLEETTNLPPSKRGYQAMSAVEQSKRVKLSGMQSCKDDERKIGTGAEEICKGDEILQPMGNSVVEETSVQTEKHLTSGSDADSFIDANNDNIKLKRDYEIMEGLAKALWKVLKEYKQKLKLLEQEVGILTNSLQNERTQNAELQREFNGLKFLCCHCREDKDYATHIKAGTGLNSKVTDTLDAEIEIHEQTNTGQLEGNDASLPSNKKEAKFFFIDGDLCTFKDKVASYPGIGGSNTLPTDFVDINNEIYQQQENGPTEKRDTSINQEQEGPSFTDGDACMLSASHPANHTFDNHIEICQQPRDGQADIKDTPSLIVPCLVNGDFCESENEVASYPGDSDSDTETGNSLLATSMLDHNIKIYEQPRDEQPERGRPLINEGEQEPWLINGMFCANMNEVSSNPRIGEFDPSTTSHLPNDTSDLQAEIDEQPRYGQSGRKEPPSPSNQEEEEPFNIDGVICVGMKGVAAHPRVSETNSTSEASPHATVKLDRQIQVHEQPVDGQSERRDPEINQGEEYRTCDDGDYDARVGEVSSSSGIDQSYAILTMTLPANDMFKVRRPPSPSDSEGEEPCNIDGVICAGVKGVAAHPRVGETNSTSEASSHTNVMLDHQIQVHEQPIDGQSERRDPAINQGEEYRSCDDGDYDARVGEVSCSSGIDQSYAISTMTLPANDVINVKRPPSPSDSEGEEPCNIDGVVCVGMKGVGAHPQVGETDSTSEASPPATVMLDCQIQVWERPIDRHSERRDPAINQKEEYCSCNEGDFAARLSEVASSPGIDQSYAISTMAHPANEMININNETYVQPLDGVLNGRDHPSQDKHEEEEPCSMAMADSVVNFSLLTADESSIRVDEVVFSGEGQGKVMFSRRSSMTLSDTVERCIPHDKPSIAKKPKRRLMPASSILLRDVSIVDSKDENENPMGRRGGRKTVVVDADDKRTNGSVTLLRLLKNAHA